MAPPLAAEEPQAAGRAVSTGPSRSLSEEADAGSWAGWGVRRITAGLMLAHAQQQQQLGEVLAAAMVRAADSALRSKDNWQCYSPQAVRQAHEAGVLEGLLQLLQAHTIVKLPDATAAAFSLLASVRAKMQGDGAAEVQAFVSALVLPVVTTAQALLVAHLSAEDAGSAASALRCILSCSGCVAAYTVGQEEGVSSSTPAPAGWWPAAASWAVRLLPDEQHTTSAAAYLMQLPQAQPGPPPDEHQALLCRALLALAGNAGSSGSSSQGSSGVGRPFFDSVCKVAESVFSQSWGEGGDNGPAAVAKVRALQAGNMTLARGWGFRVCRT